MLRFPNPGSSTSNFIAVYNAIFKRFQGQIVDLDDIVAATIDANLVTSSGYMGKRAVERSTRVDRSRDPLYNQLKMYAELFRSLGWLHPTEKKALNYSFTLLGYQVVAAGQHYLPLLEETVLGIAHPSHILSTKGLHDLRPFAFILKTMLACDNALSRDEIIVGPLSAPSDREAGSVADMAASIEELRNNSYSIQHAIAKVAKEQRTQVNTLRNYTRWPIAVMRDCGWTDKSFLKFHKGGAPFEVHMLTERGMTIARRLTGSADIRVDQVDTLPLAEKSSLSILAHYNMLDRAGFDLESVRKKLSPEEEASNQALDRLKIQRNCPLIFSPFQSLSVSDINTIFGTSGGTTKIQEYKAARITSNVVGRGSRDHLFIKPILVRRIQHGPPKTSSSFAGELRALRQRHRSDTDAAKVFASHRANDTRAHFYPLICQIFRVLGLESEYSRAGVNYQRWDACVWLGKIAIPIEIKSPTEEMFLSPKSIRQALENKIILLARGGLKTNIHITSLIVGYKIPNERGDMATLIDNIYSAFNIRIGVVDLNTLVTLAIRAVTSKLTIDHKQLGELRGFLNV